MWSPTKTVTFLDYGEYAITHVTLNGQSMPFSMDADHKAVVPRESLNRCLKKNSENQIIARLGKQDLTQTARFYQLESERGVSQVPVETSHPTDRSVTSAPVPMLEALSTDDC